MGDYLTKKIQSLNLKNLVEIRSLGLMVGIELTVGADPFYKNAHQHGILILTAGPKVLRLLPPLIITNEEINQFIQAFQNLMEDGLQ